MDFPSKILFIFFTSLGIVLGGALIGSISTIITGVQPIFTMRKMAEDMKIWAVVAALGGTFSSLEILSSGIFDGEIRPLIKQLLFIISAFAGAELGKFIIYSLTGGTS